VKIPGSGLELTRLRPRKHGLKSLERGSRRAVPAQWTLQAGCYNQSTEHLEPLDAAGV